MQHRKAAQLLILIAWLAGSAGLASDWVEGDSTMYRRPNVMPVPQPQYQQPSGGTMSSDPTVSVSDPGAPGTAPSQTSPHALEGNVNQFNSAYASSFFAPVGRTAPLPQMPEARIVQPKVFQAWLQKAYPNLGLHGKNEVVSVKGQWDDSAHAMHNFGILANKISHSKLSAAALAGTKVLVVDCAGELNEEELKAVGRFVFDGGYLLTTDWALDGCLTRAIPGFVSWNGGYSPKEMVDARIVAPFMDLVHDTPPSGYWDLEMKCQTVHVINSRAVTVLARSKTLTRDDPDQLGILALTFPYGKGRVLHLVGHFDSNTDRAFTNMLPDPSPSIGISLRQAIAANFIAQALSAQPPGEHDGATDRADARQ